MHGYEPPKSNQQGSWGDIVALTVAVFQTLFGPIVMLLLILGLSIATLIAFFSNPPLALIPLAVLVLIVWWFIRKDRQAHAEAERDTGGEGSY